MSTQHPTNLPSILRSMREAGGRVIVRIERRPLITRRAVRAVA